jgi:hypothetical protein
MIRVLAACVALAAFAGAAAAQTLDKREEAPKSPPTLMPLPPEQGEGSGSSLSDRLSESGGVIRPPRETDPQMKVPTPPTGPHSMPVIPPPGTPGGEPSPQPK